MKRISILLAICLLLGIPAQAAALQYSVSKRPARFSVTVPSVRQGEVIAEETDTGVNFYHAPSREKYGGEIGSIVVVSPRSDFFSGHYDDMTYQIISMGKRTRYFYGRPQEEALPPTEIFWMPFDGFPPPFPWRICGKAWFRLSRMDGEAPNNEDIWPASEWWVCAS